jgi:hypothetical protein
MRKSGVRRLGFALLFALGSGVAVAVANPAPRIEADLRADTRGLFHTIEHSARSLEGGVEVRL